MFIDKILLKSPLKWLLYLLFLLISNVKSDENEFGSRQLLQLVEYIGVDYPEAVANGEIINADEFLEMQQFSNLLLNQNQQLLNEETSNFNQLANSLEKAINAKRPTQEVRQLTTQLITILLKLSPELSLPSQLLSPAETTHLFQRQCASCHGLTGQGDGIVATQFAPVPTDFTDHERAVNRSLMGMYDAISQGIEGTAMSSFGQLNEQQRWSLTFFVGGLAFKSEEQEKVSHQELSLKSFVSQTPNNLASQFPNKRVKHIGWLRSNPQVFFDNSNSPIDIARQRLNEALIAHQNNELELAKSLTIAAYLDGFEMIENTLDARDTDLRRAIEADMLKLRQAVTDSKNSLAFSTKLQNTLNKLDQAERLLSADALSNSTLFSASLVILIREGLEALLVVLALLTVLIRTDRNDAIRFVHLGWLTALLAGGATWWLAQYVVNISGANREIMEGFAALLAAIVLFYVGFWMHSKTQAEQWQAYINQHVKHHLSQGTLWGIASLTFIAVYREVFETVLFYQSLLAQSHPEQYVSIGGGFLFGAALLLGIAWVMVRFSVKMPLGQFFSFTTYLMLALSFVLMGKAVAALQEAAFIMHSPLPIDITFEWLGIHSTWEGILAQSLILILSMTLVIRIIRLKKATA
ncbi:cytochrome c/FTR1 family iron permease [Aliikangiella sp. IMCC44359]|uniref:cytochrome c/FTR1 family iron permease n=1 Tax=Aliikangiella sp. IMCC44359 TaxID=3459125 RepID=UPI00403B1625